MLYGSIEAGGTKFVCAIANEHLEITERVSFPTTVPEETMKQVIAFFEQYKNELAAIGVGSFGPIDIHQDSKTYGYITSTPKLAWQNFDFVGTLKKVFDIPITWTTDVNAAAYGEYVFGQGKGLSSVVYYTVGTGIGGGAIQEDQFIEGFSHPEMGHMLVVPHPDDNFKGNCPFHGNCLEGMAAGPAIEARAGKKGQDIPADDPVWEIEASYIAQCAYNTTLLFSPDVIIFGGGVMKQRHMVEKVHRAFEELLNNYVKAPKIENYIVTPSLEDDAGTFGCLALAKKADLHVN
ncbi:fructokinase ScrK [Tetragenococcus koreensis]|uniref:fructokinase ScrK n=1 Tax=Tetragenococcus koreensis TaxID=290335 RepID=UPI001F1D17B0|nr:fructokinase ScrK [Tetragenococcus koreensis]MCF1616736.1 ROK family protein [Tetragenococcus koreensis]MCF1621618.1 ROK family protein [Tetragenococcus koreensis]MCF1677709.1 ROK family protein [Tetragenococcus koreensis]MCF1680311.1 ROK family protein [Tetragenococcus koreensis]MCF1682437.1 ROK family protein [Tetragenococcus koreensis]